MFVTLELSAEVTSQAIVNDLSKGGFSISSANVLHPGQTFRMRLPRETVACKLKWADGFTAGGVFVEPTRVPAW